VTSNPEPWLRGPLPGIPEPLQPVAHALVAALEDIAVVVADLTPAQIWMQPGDAASIGFHLLHLAGSIDRLFTYARGERLSERQRAALEDERLLSEPHPSADDLLGACRAAVDRALRQLAQTPETHLSTQRLVGRAQLPSTVRGLLFHGAEHAQRHVGQIITTAKIIRGGSGTR
jgi:uncharacterized damage-inducible protein DinB